MIYSGVALVTGYMFLYAGDGILLQFYLFNPKRKSFSSPFFVHY